MTEQEVAARRQAIEETIDHLLLARAVEVDEDVAAEDEVEQTTDRIGLLVQVRRRILTTARSSVPPSCARAGSLRP